MDKIYLVTAGDYSDYGILGVFSTKEKAESYISEYNKQKKFYEAGLEEWILDDNKLTELIAKEKWTCWINYESGNLEVHPNSSVDLMMKNEDVEIREFNSHMGNTCRVDSAISQEHANKVAVEKRQEFLRNSNKC